MFLQFSAQLFQYSFQKISSGNNNIPINVSSHYTSIIRSIEGNVRKSTEITQLSLTSNLNVIPYFFLSPGCKDPANLFPVKQCCCNTNVPHIQKQIFICKCIFPINFQCRKQMKIFYLLLLILILYITGYLIIHYEVNLLPNAHISM